MVQQAKDEKAKVKDDSELSEAVLEAIEMAVAKMMPNREMPVEQLGDMMLKQGEMLKTIADKSVPSSVKGELDRLEKEHESPYIILEDKVCVLEVSTTDLATVDGWPGYIDELLPGQSTKQGLPKRVRISIAVLYRPTIERRYSWTVMDKEEFESEQSSSSIPNASMLGAMALRSQGR